jgi:hypothetical protein
MNKNDYYFKYLKYKMKYLREKEMNLVGGEMVELTIYDVATEREITFNIDKDVNERSKILGPEIETNFGIPLNLQYLSITDETSLTTPPEKILVYRMNFVKIFINEDEIEIPLNCMWSSDDSRCDHPNFLSLNVSNTSLKDLKVLMIDTIFKKDKELDRMLFKIGDKILEEDHTKKLDYYGFVNNNSPIKPITYDYFSGRLTYISGPGFYNLLIRIPLNITCSEIKKLIEEKTNIPVDQQQLYHADRRGILILRMGEAVAIPNDITLEDYRILENEGQDYRNFKENDTLIVKT